MESRRDAKEKEWNVNVSIVKAQNGDEQAKSLLVEHNIGLIHMVLKRFWGRGYDMEDLFQVGAIGLLKAINRFDVTLGYSFSTYAVPIIIGEIRRFIRDDGLLHISRKIKEDTKKVAQISEEIRRTENREPTTQELAMKTGLDVEEIFLAVESCYEVQSLSQPVSNGKEGGAGQEIALQDKISDGNFSQGKLIDQLLLKQVLDKLEEEEQLLIVQRYLLGRTQSETAKYMGMNQVAVSRKEKKVLQKLRLYMEDKT